MCEQGSIKKDSILTFVPIGDSDCAKISENDAVFSIPYSKIFDASQFCERERLDFVFVGHFNGEWQIETSEKKLKHYVKVTINGLSPDVDCDYIYSVQEVTTL